MKLHKTINRIELFWNATWGAFALFLLGGCLGTDAWFMALINVVSLAIFVTCFTLAWRRRHD